MTGLNGSWGNTRHIPSACRKNSISMTPVARDASTRTALPRLASPVQKGVIRVGSAPFEISQLFTIASNEFVDASINSSVHALRMSEAAQECVLRLQQNQVVEIGAT
nr:hypothetical protein [Paraburkholderia sp. BL6669N2]